MTKTKNLSQKPKIKAQGGSCISHTATTKQRGDWGFGRDSKSITLFCFFLGLTFLTSSLAQANRCTSERLAIFSIHTQYQDFKDELWSANSSQSLDTLNQIEQMGGASFANINLEETCRWNRFILTDFILYFDRLQDIHSDLKSTNRDPFRIQTRQLRDRLFKEWMNVMVHVDDNKSTDWEGVDLEGESIQDYLKRGSSRFGALESAITLIYSQPKYSRLQDEAHFVIFRLLQGKNPLSGILKEFATREIQKPEVQETLSCLESSLSQSIAQRNCQDDIFTQALTCAQRAGADQEVALEALGIFSSQRGTLVHDLKNWFKANLDEDSFQDVFSALRHGAETYFQLETFGEICSLDKVYPQFPDQRVVEHQTPKSYHFWSTALLTYKLGKLGFSHDVSIPAAIGPAHRYKKSIKIPGMLWNTVLGFDLKAGAVSDIKPVLAQQKLGAEFGYQISQSAQSSPKVISLSIAPLLKRYHVRSLSVLDWKWQGDRINLYLKIKSRTASGVDKSYRLELPISTPPGFKEELNQRRVFEPRIHIEGETLQVIY